MEKISTDKKQIVAKYTAVAGAFLASGAVNSQVIYVDINPDAVVNKNNSPYSLDLNWDAQNDIYVKVVSSSSSGTSYGMQYAVTGSYASIAGVGTGGVMMNSASTNTIPISSGNAIGSSANFGNGYQSLGSVGAVMFPSSPSNNYTISNGAFLGLSDQFVGVKFIVGTFIHFGWIRLDVDTTMADLTVRIKDYAFNTVAGESIEAGELAGLGNIPVDQKVTIKTHFDEAFVNVTPDLIGGSIVITDMNGREVKSSPINDVNTKVTYSGIDTGIYIIVARFESGSVSKKIYVN